MGHNGPIYWPPRVPCSDSARPGQVITGALGQGKGIQFKRYVARRMQVAGATGQHTPPIDPFKVADGPSACAHFLRGQWVAWLDELGGPVLRPELVTVHPRDIVIGGVGQGKNSARSEW